MRWNKTIGLVVSGNLLIFGGTNNKASVFIDYDAATPAMENSITALPGQTCVFAVRCSGLRDVAGYHFTAEIDTAYMLYQSFSLVYGSQKVSLLESSGAPLAPKLDVSKNGNIDIAIAVAGGHNLTQTSELNGVLLYCTLKIVKPCKGIGFKNCILEKSDSHIVIDTFFIK
jgi:hypothetical protein